MGVAVFRRNVSDDDVVTVMMLLLTVVVVAVGFLEQLSVINTD